MPTNRPLPGAALAVVLLLSLAAPAAGQRTDDGGPDPATVRVRMGPLWMNPSISLPNVGVDTNVFNEPPSATPKKDFTMTVAPKADMWLRMGRTWLSGMIAEDVVWYQKYESERSTNHLLGIGWKAPLNRVTFDIGASWLSTRTRPGYEIDVRVRRREPALSSSLEVQAFGKTYFGARANWRDVSYEDQEYQGTNLKEELDRTVTNAAITIRHELTPLTSITLSAGRSEQRFETDDSRRSTSDDYTVAFTFDPDALLKGVAKIGYTNYKPESADLPGYRGSTAEVNLTYDLLNATRFVAIVNRAIEFSYDNDQPYYVLTGTGGSISQRIGGPVDVLARASHQRLHYQNRVGSQPEADRTDHVRSYGAGAGVRLGEELRLGFYVDRERRTSILSDHEYEGLKFGTSLTYGL
jgi:hypothetical protein